CGAYNNKPIANRVPPVCCRTKHTWHLDPARLHDLKHTCCPRKIFAQMMSTRTNFLAACQANNYQFDTIRRARYATMMTMFHLRHPGAPTTLPLC
ncbi:unnamed protein product, partial [Scytosiphon promiscuus]